MAQNDQWSDILLPRRKSSDLFWIAFNNWYANSLKDSKNRDPITIKNNVFNEPFIKKLIENNENVRKDIEKILEEMAHSWSLRSIRFVGYFLTKIMKSIYRHVWIEEEIQFSSINGDSSVKLFANARVHNVINELALDYPILYMPTHRSYADFLLFSYVCFHLNLPLPSIVAGNDFLSLNQVASLLRACGAFFIRRSFKQSNDFLYWHIFRAYLQTQIKGGERPVEFFIEGTRSRNGKFLYPKLGLLTIILELFLTAQVPDIIIVPVAITYDRTLEEELYAKELSPPLLDPSSGTKPKETTKHLFTAAKAIMSQDYGSVYVRFGEPLSIQQLTSNWGGDKRKQYAKHPRDLPLKLNSKEEFELIEKIAVKVIESQRNLLVVSPFSLFSMFIFSELIEQSDYTKRQLSYDVTDVIAIIKQFKQLLPNEIKLTNEVNNLPIDEEFFQCLQIHKNLVELNNEKTKVIIDQKNHLVINEFRHYANQALQMFIEFAIACFSDSFFEYNNVKVLLSKEFIFSAFDDENEFKKYEKMKLTCDHSIIIYFQKQINYYLNEYIKIYEYLINLTSTPISNLNDLSKQVYNKLNVQKDIVQNAIFLFKDKSVFKNYDHCLMVDVKKLNELFINRNLNNSNQVIFKSHL